nr:sugar ABC transporter permease [Streptococcus suis]
MQQTNRKIDRSVWRQHFVDQSSLWLLALPGIILVLLFSYGPMVGLYMAFTNYSPSNQGFIHDLTSAQFVGTEWFTYFFKNDFMLVMRNTLFMSILTLLFSFPIPIMIALAINEVRIQWIKKTIQTVSYLPYFISWVIVANIIITFLSSDGIVNSLLQMIGATDKEVLFMQKGEYFWWIMAIANTWKSMGYNSIIYLAAISGINVEQYEAADVDGATR